MIADTTEASLTPRNFLISEFQKRKKKLIVFLELVEQTEQTRQ